MTVLVTGGAGFIGSHLVESIIAGGDKVRIIDNFCSGKHSNIPSGVPSIEVVEGDIRDRAVVREAMRGVDRVCHLAALVSVPESIAHPDVCFDINAHGTQIVLDEARKAGVQKVVLASSAAVYGNNANLPLSECESPSPLSPYGLDKLYAEKLGKVYQELYGIEVTALRFFNVFGPRQDPTSPYSGVISIFMEKMVARMEMKIFGDGKQTRDFVYVKDIVTAVIGCFHSNSSSFRVFNVGRGVEVSINNLLEILSNLLKDKIRAEYKVTREGDIVHSLADISAISGAIAYAPEYSLEEGLAETLEWYMAEQGK